jgi:hypothetical protein
MIARLLAFPFLVLAYGACTAPVGSNLEVPSNATSTCETHCRSIGLELSAVAIMANNVGCVCQRVCQRALAPQLTSDGRESVTAGMATIMLQQEEQERSRQAQSNQQK